MYINICISFRIMYVTLLSTPCIEVKVNLCSFFGWYVRRKTKTKPARHFGILGLSVQCMVLYWLLAVDCGVCLGERIAQPAYLSVPVWSCLACNFLCCKRKDRRDAAGSQVLPVDLKPLCVMKLCLLQLKPSVSQRRKWSLISQSLLIVYVKWFKVKLF